SLSLSFSHTRSFLKLTQSQTHKLSPSKEHTERKRQNRITHVRAHTQTHTHTHNHTQHHTTPTKHKHSDTDQHTRPHHHPHTHTPPHGGRGSTRHAGKTKEAPGPLVKKG